MVVSRFLIQRVIFFFGIYARIIEQAALVVFYTWELTVATKYVAIARFRVFGVCGAIKLKYICINTLMKRNSMVTT